MLPYGERGLQTQVWKFRVQVPRRPARSLGRKAREGQTKRQKLPSQTYLALRRVWCGQLFAAMVLLLVWSEASGVWCVFSSGATQETTGLAAAKFCRSGGSGTTESKSCAAGGIKVTARQRADRCQTRRGFEPGQRQVQQQGGCQQAQRPGYTHSAAAAVCQGRSTWRPFWKRRNWNATSSRYSCRTTSRFTNACVWPRRRGQRPARLWRSPRRRRPTSWSFLPSSVRKSISSRPLFCNTTTMSSCWSRGIEQRRAVQILVSSKYQASKRWHRFPQVSGLRGFATASTHKRGKFSILSARSSSTARIQKEACPTKRLSRPRLRLQSRRQPPLEPLRRFRGPDQPGWIPTRLRPRHRRAGAPVFAGTSVLVHNVDWCGRCAYSFSIRDER